MSVCRDQTLHHEIGRQNHHQLEMPSALRTNCRRYSAHRSRPRNSRRASEDAWDLPTPVLSPLRMATWYAYLFYLRGHTSGKTARVRCGNRAHPLGENDSLVEAVTPASWEDSGQFRRDLPCHKRQFRPLIG